MNKNEYFTIKGYINILKSAPPNGRYVHQIKNKLQGLQLYLDSQINLPSHYEYEVRKLIDALFESSSPVNNIDKKPGDRAQ